MRGKIRVKKMSDLPTDRLTTDPPFTHVRHDVFGTWNVTTWWMRGGAFESRRWAVIFACLSTRAIHLEVIESMLTLSFIKAFRCFLSIGGPVRHLRSDRGMNFIGACRELQVNTDDPEIKKYLKEQGCTWTLNAPHCTWEELGRG